MKKRIKQLQIFISILLIVGNIFTTFTAMAQTEQKEENQNIESTKSGYFTVWVSSSQDIIKAEFEKGLYGGTGHPVSVIGVDLKEKGIWYRTCVGRFSSKQEASQFGNYLQETLNIEWFKILYLK